MRYIELSFSKFTQRSCLFRTVYFKIQSFLILTVLTNKTEVDWPIIRSIQGHENIGFSEIQKFPTRNGLSIRTKDQNQDQLLVQTKICLTARPSFKFWPKSEQMDPKGTEPRNLEPRAWSSYSVESEPLTSAYFRNQILVILRQNYRSISVKGSFYYPRNDRHFKSRSFTDFPCGRCV